VSGTVCYRKNFSLFSGDHDVTFRALAFLLALSVAAAGRPFPVHADEGFVVTLTDQSDETNQVVVRCTDALPCTATLTLFLGKMKVDLAFVMEAHPGHLYVRTVDWREADWHFDLMREGSGRFGFGRSQGTLWLRTINGVQNPVVHSPEGIKVARILVSFVRDNAPASTPDSKEGVGGVPM